MESSATTIEDFLHVNCIKRFLNEDESRWGPRIEHGWTNESRLTFQRACDSILARLEWPEKARAALSSQDEMKFFHADQATKALGIDTWEIHWQRLKLKPADPSRWYHVMALCN